MANWSELPGEIIGLFVKRLPPYLEEFARFASVCRSWKCVAAQEKKHMRFGPWLMLAKLENDNTGDLQGIRSFYSVASDKVFSFPLPQLQGSRCWGTPCGWLVTLDRHLDIHLFNPLTRLQKSLPSQLTFTSQRDLVYAYPEDRPLAVKFALSSNPSDCSNSLLVMAILGPSCELAFASPGDQAWTSLKCPPSENYDVIFYKDHFYSISNQGMLRICDFSTTVPEARDIASPPVDPNAHDYNYYLVEFSGDLHLIARTRTAADSDYDYGPYHLVTIDFEVFKFDLNKKKWDEVEHFDDHALFVGNNTSFVISTTNYPHFRPNSIYFTDDQFQYYSTEFCDMGVYDFERGDMTEDLHDEEHLISKLLGVYDFKMPTMTESETELFYDEEHLISKLSRPVFFMPTLGP